MTSGVPLDLTISKTIDEVYAEFNGKVSKEAIKALVDFQSFTVRKGIEDGDNIHLRHIGSFQFNHKRAYKVQQDGIQGTMQTEQVITQKEGSKSYKIKEIRRIVFKKG